MPKYRKLSTRVLESHSFDCLPNDTAKLLWVLLPLVMSRDGTFPAHLHLIVSRVFPLRDDVTEQQVQDALDIMYEQDMIRYYKVDDRLYFWMPKWVDYQGDCTREADSPYPPVPQTIVNGSRPSRDQLMNMSCSVFSIQYSDSLSPENGDNHEPETPPTESETPPTEPAPVANDPLPFDDTAIEPVEIAPEPGPMCNVQFDTPQSQALLARLRANAVAKGHAPPQRFGSLEQKAAWVELETRLTASELDARVERALRKGITGLSRIIAYISAFKSDEKSVTTLDRSNKKLSQLMERGIT